MSRRPFDVTLKELLIRIEELENILHLEEDMLREMEKLGPAVRFSELKMMHHFAVLIARSAIRNGATVQ